MKLYGTRTSPYVRKVRIVALELEAEHELFDTASAEGQRRLRELTPLWKVPIASFHGDVVFDSHNIVERLIAENGMGPLRPVAHAEHWREANLGVVIEGALDSAINVFYLQKEGADPQALPYLAKQRARVDAAMAWVQGQLRGSFFTDQEQLGLTELTLAVALDWMVLRDAWPVAEHPALVAFRDTHAARPSFVQTRPVA